jgi:hypothetical protein
MLARERTVNLHSGHALSTPLLLPSVSSAGFKRVELEGGGSEPEPAAWLRVVNTALTDGLLISAYDIAHGLLPYFDELQDRFTNSIYALPTTLFIDSGLYERAYGPPPFDGVRLDWNEDAYYELVARLDPTAQVVLVNYDGYDDNGLAPYDQQIARAQEFFVTYEGFGNDLIIKPDRLGGRLDPRHIPQATLEALRGFDIVSFAEKDLGDSLLDRLCNLATLRRDLDAAGVDSPIHLFGSLDPVMTPLYFAAGAEIFDGLTWLRYGYHWEASMYRDNVPVLEEGQSLSEPERVRTASLLFGNLKALRVLSERMRQYAVENDWTIFGDRVAGQLAAAHLALKTKVGG